MSGDIGEVSGRAAAPGKRLWWRSLLGLAAGLGLAATVLLLLGVSRRDVIESLRRVTLGPLAVAAAGSLVLLALQSLRWWVVMKPVLPLRYGQAYRAMMVGFFFNVLLPAHAGDLLRVQYLGKRTGVSRAKLLATEVVDYFSDKWGWIASFPILCLFGKPPSWLIPALMPIAAGVLAVAVAVALLGSGIYKRPWPRWAQSFRDGFAASHWKRLLLIETLLAPLPWLFETGLILFAQRALGLSLTPMQAFATLCAFNAATLVPSPGNAGSFEAGGTFALVAFGVPKETALTFILLYHLSQLLPGVIGGALVLVREGETLFGKNSLFRIAAPSTDAATEAERVA